MLLWALDIPIHLVITLLVDFPQRKSSTMDGIHICPPEGNYNHLLYVFIII